MKLSCAKLGEEYTVCRVTNESKMLTRFSDLGIIKGAKIKPLFKSPFGEPTAYEVSGAVIALRCEDSNCILVKKKQVSQWG